MVNPVAAALVGLLAAGCVVMTAGCKRDRERLVGEEEIEALRARTLAAAEESRTRRCERPVLRGEPREGPADEALVAVATMEGPLKGCAEALREIERSLDEFAPAVGDGDKAPRVAAPLGDAPGPRERVVGEACAALPAAVARAAAHEDACSPFSPGRRAALAMLLFIRSAYAIAAPMRALARGGEGLAAAQLGLDHVRVQQDLLRGGSWLTSSVTTATLHALMPQLELVLQDPSLGEEQLAVLAAELDALLATEVHVADILRGEALWLDLYQSLPAFQPEGWEPPGGWPSGYGPPRRAPGERIAEIQAFSADERDDAALAWVAVDEVARAQLDACPPEATFDACADALDRVAAGFAAGAEHLPPGERTNPAARRAAALAVLKGVSVPSLRRYVERHASRPAALAALRVLVEARRLHAADGACPTLAAFEEPPLAPLLSPPQLDQPLEPRAAADGAIELWPPAWLSDDDRPVPILRVRCGVWTR